MRYVLSISRSPPGGQVNALVHADDQLVPGPRDAHAHPGHGAEGATGRDVLMGRVSVETRRGEAIKFALTTA